MISLRPCFAGPPRWPRFSPVSDHVWLGLRAGLGSHQSPIIFCWASALGPVFTSLRPCFGGNRGSKQDWIYFAVQQALQAKINPIWPQKHKCTSLRPYLAGPPRWARFSPVSDHVCRGRSCSTIQNVCISQRPRGSRISLVSDLVFNNLMYSDMRALGPILTSLRG